MKKIIKQILKGGGKTQSFLLAALFAFAAAETAQAGWTINDVQTKTTDWSQSSSWVDIASGDNKTGILTNNYTGTVTIGQNFDVGRKGSGAKGEYVQNAGTVNVGGSSGSGYNLIIGYEGSLTANVIIAGGTMNVLNDIEVPKNAACTSSLKVKGSGSLVGKNKLYLRKGTVTVDSGTVNIAKDFSMGSNGDATLTINGGTTTVGAWTKFESSNYSKTVNLNGGTLETYHVNSQGTSGTQQVVFNGGTLKKKASSAYSLIHANIAAKVGAKGGTININNLDTTIEANFSDSNASTPGAIKFCGGGNVTLTGSIGYTGGTTIEFGTCVKVPNSAAKDLLMGSVLTVTGPASKTGTVPLVTITGGDKFADADLAKVSAPAGMVAQFLDDKATIGFIIPDPVSLNQSQAQLVFEGATLADLATHTLRARFKGDSITAAITGIEATFFGRTEYKDGDTLTNVVYQLQTLDGSYAKAVKVSFTEGVGGVYAKLVDGNYSNYGNQNQFGTEPLNANSGKGAYIPYDLRLVEPVSDSINVNFTRSADLDTSSSVRYGGGDYAVPYSAWTNMPAANGGTKTVGGATFKVTKTSGAFGCSDLNSAKDLRHGYLDDGGLTVVVDVTGIPYEFYRIVTYHATDNADVKFGHVTINGIDYTGVGIDYTGVMSSTVRGNAAWGATGAKNKAEGLREGLNYLVSDVMEGSSATITGHRDAAAPTCRGCIAAIQIVEYTPPTYTATISAAGTVDFSSLAWNETLPASLAGVKLVVNVEEDATLNVDSAISARGVEFNVADGKTLTLSGSTVSAEVVGVKGAGKVVAGSASQLAGTVRGNGTLVYDGFQPAASATFADAQWTGTVWIKNIGSNGESAKVGTCLGTTTGSANAANAASDWGNSGSFVKFTNVRGYFSYATFPWTLVLEDDGGNYAWYNNNGWTARAVTFAGLAGDGTFYDVNFSDCRQPIAFTDASAFTGAIVATGKRIGLGGAPTISDDAAYAGTIDVLSGKSATVAAGKTWTAAYGIVVNGTLNLGAGATAPAVAGGTGTVAVASGTGTLNGYGAAATLTLATAPGATLVISDGTLTSMTVGALNNLGTIDLTGTALTEATLNLASGVTTAATGTIRYPATFEKFVALPADQSIRSLDGFTAPTLPAGAAYYVTVAETREEYGKGSLAVTDAASGVNVRVARPNGTFADVVPVDGTATLAGVHIAGASTAFDFTYTNTAEKAYSAPGLDIGWNCDQDANGSRVPTFNNENADKTTGVHIRHHPWVTGAGNLIHDLDNFTIVLVGTMSPSHNTQFFHMGTTTTGNTGLLITTTENDNEVLIARNTAGTVDAKNGVVASVSNAATARHAYVIYKKGTVFEVWVDGVKRGQFDGGEGFTLSAGGMQVGSDHGGVIHGGNANDGVYKAVPINDTDETGYLNVLRMFDYTISDAQAEAVFAEYPYVSQGGLYTRTVAADGTFSETDTWAKDGAAGAFAVPVGSTVDEVYYNPSATLTVNAEATMTVNADVALENLTVGGSSALTFAADGAHTISVVGAAFINSPVTNEYGAVYLAGAPVRLGSSGAICFDCSSLDVSEVYAVTRFQLTGLIARDDEKMSFVPPADPDRSYAIVYNTTGSCYDLVVTPNHDYVVVENLRAALEATDDTIIVGAGGVKVSSLGIPAAGKLTLDPIKTPVYVSAAPTFGEGVKIALSPSYAGMTLGRVVLLTWTGEATLPENLNSLFDASSVAGSAVVTAEAAPNGTSTQLVLTVGDYDRDAKEIRILPVGDSITQGVASSGKGASGQSDDPQYRTAIAARLAANGYKPKMLGVWKRYPWDAAGVTQPNDWIWHSGISAERIITGGERGGVQDNMHVYLDIAGDVNAITFLIGTNDLGAGTPVADTYAAFTNLMFKTATERPNAKIFGSTILDRNEADSENHGNVVAFNALLRADYAAGNLPANFVMVDLFEDIPLTTGVGGNFLSDKLHMNWAGCAIASEKFADAIMAALPLAGAGAISGNPDPTVTDAPQTALGAANVAELADYRSGMTKVYTIDAAATNAFTAAPYTTIDDTSALSRPVLKAGYYMELVRKGTNRRRYVWVDFDATGKTLGDIDFPWTGANMQFVAEKLHVYSNDPSIHNVAANDDSASGIVEGTWHNYSEPAVLADAPADIADKFGWNDTLSSSGNGYGCFQTHRILSETEAEVLFAWNSWGGGRANYADDFGIGSFGKSTTLGKNFSMDYTFTCETSDGAADTLAANAYSVRRVEIWAVFDGAARPGVWTGFGGDNDFDNAANWENGAVPADGAAVDFSALPTNATISVTGASAAKTFGAVTMGANVVTFTGTFKATSFSDTSKVAVGENATVTLDGDLVIDGSTGNKILYKVDEGGKFIVTGAVRGVDSDIRPVVVAGTGCIVVNGVEIPASKSLYSTLDVNTQKWAIGPGGITGSGTIWCLSNKANDCWIYPYTNDFTISAWTVVRDAIDHHELNTTGYGDGLAHTITLDAGFSDKGKVFIAGTGKVVVNHVTQAAGGKDAYSGEVTVTNTATLAINQGKKLTSGAITVCTNATLQVAQSGEVALGGNLTLDNGAILGFNFTDRRNPPVLNVTDKTVTLAEGGTVKVKVSAANGVWPKGENGKVVLTSGGKFGGKAVELATGSENWAESVDVNDAGNIVLTVKPRMTMILVR